MLRKAKGKSTTAVGAMAKGVLWAVLLTLAGAVTLGKLVDRQILQMESVGYGAMAVLGVSAWVAASSAIKGMYGNRYLNAAIGSGVYFAVLLLVNALFFGGEYPGFWSGLAVTLLGMGTAVLTTGQGRGRASRKRYKIPKG